MYVYVARFYVSVRHGAKHLEIASVDIVLPPIVNSTTVLVLQNFLNDGGAGGLPFQGTKFRCQCCRSAPAKPGDVTNFHARPVEANDPHYFCWPIQLWWCRPSISQTHFVHSVLILRLNFSRERLRNHTEERDQHCQYSKRVNWKIVFIFFSHVQYTGSFTLNLR